MREIKFRGFNRKNGVWLYGFYLTNRGAHFVCPDEFADGKSWDDYEIDPETRGEYMGQKDKNGQEIYEGDVVATVVNGCRYVQEVVWSDITNGFSFRGHGCGPMFHKPSCMEVIGNIHDRSAMTDDITLGTKERLYTDILLDIAGHERTLEAYERMLRDGKLPEDMCRMTIAAQKKMLEELHEELEKRRGEEKEGGV